MMKIRINLRVLAGLVAAMIFVLYFSWSSENDEARIKETLETIRQEFSQPPPESLMAKAKTVLGILEHLSDKFEARIDAYYVTDPNELKELLVIVSQQLCPIHSTLGYEHIEIVEDEALVRLQVTIESSARSDQHKPGYLLFIRLLREDKEWKIRSVSDRPLRTSDKSKAD